ncbi:MAG: DUF4145 domain-containing protein [Desulfomonilaceae bacterium]
MNMSYTAPERDETPFHCPHCNVMAQQKWQRLLWEDLIRYARSQHYEVEEHSPMPPAKLEIPPMSLDPDNSDMLAICECQNCKGISIWLYDQMLYPDGYAPPPNSDLNDEIKRDYLEAGSIVNKSPRGAAALLRLCIEKLCDQLGAKGKGINEQIGYLVREKNLDPRIQQSLDVVRVIGNESVHPGIMDLRDDKETAMSLFRLINVIADMMVTQPKHIQEMYDKLPDGKKKGIHDRDKRK